MKINVLKTVFIALLVSYGCSEDVMGPRYSEKVLTVSVGDVSSRAGFDGTGAFYWSKVDAIGVTSTEVPEGFSKMFLKTGGGSNTATFSGNVLGDFGRYAVYPYYEDKHFVSGSRLTYSFPSEYTYTKVDPDYFTPVQGEGNSFCPAMWGEIREHAVQLKHLGGVFAVKFNKLPVGDHLQFQLKSDKKMNGTYAVDLQPGCAFVAESSSEADDNVVRINFSNVKEAVSGVFYVPVPTGIYTNVRVKIVDLDESGKELLNALAGTYTISRKLLKKLEFNEKDIEAVVPVEVLLSEAGDVLREKNDIAVTDEVSGRTNEIVVPAIASRNSGQAVKSVSLQKLAPGAAIKISDGNCLTGNGNPEHSVAGFTFSVPWNDAQEYISAPLDVELDLPNTKVTFAGNAGKALYGKVTVSTAEDTASLVIDKGVSVNEMTVNKGYVRVCKGAVVRSFVKGSAGHVWVEAEEGSVVPEILPEGYEYVTPATRLRCAMAVGGEYRLKEDVNIEGAYIKVPAGVDAVLDLNGYNISANNKSSDRITVLGKLLLKDSKNTGTITVNHDYAGGYSACVIEVSGAAADFVMEGGRINTVRPGNISNNGQFGLGISYGATITIKGGIIESGWYAISGNGTDTEQQCKINIEGGTLVSKADYAIYLPHNGLTTINGGVLNGASGAVSIMRGSLVVNGGTFYSNDSGDTGDWGDGTAGQGNQVIHVTSKYDDCNVEINGGKFIATGSAPALLLAPSGKHKGTVTINGGIFRGKVECSKSSVAVLNIKGGQFSDPSIMPYLTDQAEVKVMLDKDMKTDGYIIGKNIKGQPIDVNVVFDLNQKEWTINDRTVGSSGTETNGFQLLQGKGNCSVKFMNGTLNSGNAARIFLQNYTALTLDNMVVNGTGKCEYVVSNNNGECNIVNSTIENKVPGQCAFDIYVWPQQGYVKGVTVKVEGDRSAIRGKVEFGGDSKKQAIGILDIRSGTFTGPLVVQSGYEAHAKKNIRITGGTFSDHSFDEYFVSGAARTSN